ncbi:ABC transporter ATP-binding protein [Coraliomargarita akajimensis]|uniref:ABC transporter related protein n=1 Tax=Coraliomargarita akajimensis (strain DSM 45221 / IAM 15411 / JCM 23193 / KCTC 12865 / 04OKA010-24) TaxID=583355 RepID=D5ELF6_CORAD|nr:ABC transporter ATP-binding protein [Coraliomargarita akajimensis]ADE55092.1 ABC transporter related protein [Coraliomargarita akajimensis DSM 45221]
MSDVIELPSYKEQSEAVRQRFVELKQRPIKLEVKGVSKSFTTAKGTVDVLSPIEFNVHRREFVSIIGPSGCGKSTLIRMLAGLETLSGGSFLLDGKEPDGPGADRGMVFQGYTLFPWLSVKKNVMFGLEVNGRSGTAVEQEALQWIELVGLAHAADKYPSQLSGGMKQRVAIARALANQPQILFMDEPFGALDPHTRTQMQSHLLQIWRNVDVTIMFVTHDLDEAIYLSDRILVLKANPGEIHEFIEVPVARPRTPECMLSPEFLATKQRLEELIHPKTEADSQPLPMVRLTSADDDVE